jgi:hypothetical protein
MQVFKTALWPFRSTVIHRVLSTAKSGIATFNTSPIISLRTIRSEFYEVVSAAI